MAVSISQPKNLHKNINPRLYEIALHLKMGMIRRQTCTYLIQIQQKKQVGCFYFGRNAFLYSSSLPAHYTY